MENNLSTNKTKKYVCVVLWLTPVVLGVYLFNEFQNINHSSKFAAAR